MFSLKALHIILPLKFSVTLKDKWRTWHSWKKRKLEFFIRFENAHAVFPVGKSNKYIFFKIYNKMFTFIGKTTFSLTFLLAVILAEKGTEERPWFLPPPSTKKCCLKNFTIVFLNCQKWQSFKESEPCFVKFNSVEKRFFSIIGKLGHLLPSKCPRGNSGMCWYLPYKPRSFF